jgi:hypothetical protein
MCGDDAADGWAVAIILDLFGSSAYFGLGGEIGEVENALFI